MSDDKYGRDTAINAETGLPEMTDEERNAIKKRIAFLPMLFFKVVMLALGCGIAYPIYKYGDKDKYDARMLLAKEADQ